MKRMALIAHRSLLIAHSSLLTAHSSKHSTIHCQKNHTFAVNFNNNGYKT